MVAMYKVAGMQVGSHYLAMATLGSVFAGTFLMMGGSKKPMATSPPLNASSKPEEDFIQQFLKNADGDAAKREGSANAVKQ
ncbi:hypothetical protein LTR95_013235 [Oleoguttula sp. CCFEE 5521]|uniref:ATP synthase subunit K, mitochondrial n=1 Tax=Cryoendolithus antarcticus TaxID=1507870 RepID=A0A1V8T1V0_9PEZI|nr:hypothetical protein B0A48_12100 [Cryoendolithus antarcticus]OQO05405.1 hypothetical protein B0A48_09173 [Cryoendolithus antarcticus]OQO26465.1 hypothetical protein B0A51_05700 [Rachicladosporium sp. CCFEE 5018]OQO32065.1 hypothetical protein B0A51_00603 [Rachicladosporium sp. CCFEE 5018]